MKTKKCQLLEEELNKAGLHYYKNEEQTVMRFTLCSVELASFLLNFGAGARNKKIDSRMFYAEDCVVDNFLKGYFEADGHYNKNVSSISFSSVSKELAYGIKRLVEKYYKVSCCITMAKPRKKSYIEGRAVANNISYVGTFFTIRKRQSHYVQENNSFYLPVRNVEYFNEAITVYNLSVEEDESYTANGVIVHNCTYWSSARAKGTGRELTPDGIGGQLFMQYVRALKECKPKYFLYENNNSMGKL